MQEKNKIMNMLEEIGKKFDIPGVFDSFDTITAGNINGTYRVFYKTETGLNCYIFQKVNTYVFKNPEYIMSNIAYVTGHIQSKCGEGRQTLKFFTCDDGKNFYESGDGGFWRVCNNIESCSIDSCNDLNILRDVGKAFGEFQNMLADFDAAKLFETIPDFHNTKKRIQTLYAHIDEDVCGRVKDVTEEIAFIKRNEETAFKLTEMLEKGELPLRVTHNDTKINNVLFDSKTGSPIAIIDLDTVMPGLAMHDFGDAVRFACNTAAEDEKDVSLVSLDMDKFKAFAEGFISETEKALTRTEIETMTLGAVTITIELAVRFLDDYITGDKYFKTLYEGHNLVRTRCQLKLANDMLSKYDQMQEIISSIR